MNRDAQCASLMAYNPTAKPSPDRSSFELAIKFPPNGVVTLRVDLPADFPRAAPALRITTPGVSHPWLDAQGRVVGLTELYNWDWRTSDLGTLVHLAKSQFIAQPPILSQPSSRQTPPPAPGRSVPLPPARSAAAATPQNAKPDVYASLPQIPNEFPELRSMSAAQLQALLDSEDAFMALFNTLGVVSTANALRESIAENNVTLARRNLAHKNEVQRLEATVASLAAEVAAARDDYERNVDASARYPSDPRRMADELEALAMESDNESERLMPRLLARNSPETDAEAWTKHRELRILYHTRMGKAEMCRKQQWG